MTKRLVTLLVVSGIFFSSAKATDNIQEVASRTWSDIYDAVSKAAHDSLNSLAHAANDVEKLAQQEMQKIGSRIDLHVTKQNSGLLVTTLGDGSDVPMLAVDGIKKLTQAITPEYAANTCVKLYKEIVDDALKMLHGVIDPYEKNFAACAAVEKAMRTKANSFDLAIMLQALPKDVMEQCCKRCMIESAQECMNLIHGFGYSLDVEPKISGWLEEYLYSTVDALVDTLEQHYTIDRTALGLEQVPAFSEE